MRKILITLIGIILLLAFVSWYNTSPAVIISRLNESNGGLEVKARQLRYRVYLFKVFPVGEAVFNNENVVEEYNGQRVYHLSATASNLKLLSKFFNASAQLDSYIDMRNFNPLLFKQRLVVSGKPDLYKEVYYDQENHIMSIDGERRRILADTQDPLSAVFNIRRIDFSKIKDFEISINTNQKNYVLRGIAQTKGVSIKKKAYKAAFLKANISRRDKSRYHKSSIAMVLLEENGNIPVLINVFAKGIVINVRLVGIK
ncbi:MAG: DUF3108 domain-containing protein [Candidatus Omnitrophota bacterium]